MFKEVSRFPLSALATALLLFSSPATAEPVLLFEIEAAVVENTQPYVFQVFGDKDEDGTAYTAYGIQVVAPGGGVSMLDEFESMLPANSEADALVVEDVNFDGYADLRIMQYLTGGSAVPYYYWLYQPSSGNFERAEFFESVKSPQVDADNRQLVSKQKLSSSETVTEFYEPQGFIPVMVRKEVRNYAPDGSSKVHVFLTKDGAPPHLVETRQLGPGED